MRIQGRNPNGGSRTPFSRENESQTVLEMSLPRSKGWAVPLSLRTSRYSNGSTKGMVGSTTRRRRSDTRRMSAIQSPTRPEKAMTIIGFILITALPVLVRAIESPASRLWQRAEVCQINITTLWRTPTRGTFD